MRVLGSERNKLTLRDHFNDGATLTVFYRTPTTKERVAYRLARSVRIKGKVVDKSNEARQSYGLAILTGILDGDFGVLRGDQVVPISSDPGSDHFDPKWKEIVAEQAGDVVEMLAIQVFDFPVSVANGFDATDEPEATDAAGDGKGAEGNS